MKIEGEDFLNPQKTREGDVLEGDPLARIEHLKQYIELRKLMDEGAHYTMNVKGNEKNGWVVIRDEKGEALFSGENDSMLEGLYQKSKETKEYKDKESWRTERPGETQH